MNPVFTTSASPLQLSVCRDIGARLPEELLPLLEAVFGTTFENVRVHISGLPAMIGARAFALGDDLYFSPGEYNPRTREGLLTLGHELAHVIQQSAGRVPVRDDLELVCDAALETEADMAGQCLADAFDSGNLPEQPFIAAKTSEMGRQTRAIQCLWQVVEFQEATQARGRRNKILAVENAMTTYHNLGKSPRDYAALIQQIKNIIMACDQYTRERPNSGRAGGVRTLNRQAAIEQMILLQMLGYQQATDLGEQWDYLLKAQEILLHYLPEIPHMKESGYPNIQDWVNNAMVTMTGQVEGTDAGVQAVANDLEQLKQIGAAGETPNALQAVITEVATAQNLNQIDPRAGRPGCTYNFNIGQGQERKYTLNHGISQLQGGRTARLGSLLHELTHISNSETFGNSVIMLACPIDATDDEMLQLASTRAARVRALLLQVEQAPLAAPGAVGSPQSLTQPQKDQLKEKLEYIFKTSQTDLYISLLERMEKKDFLNPRVRDKQVAMGERMKSLKARGLRNELVEYDSVMNQTCLWCHLWKLHSANSVYQSLQDAVRVAHGYRMAERGKGRQIVNPLVVDMMSPSVRSRRHSMSF